MARHAPNTERRRSRRRTRRRRRATPGAALRSPSAPAARRRRTSVRATAPRQLLRPGDLGNAVANHPLDLERHRERSEILGEVQLDLLARLTSAVRGDEVLDLELQRVLAVHLQMLDERRA